MTRGPLLLGPRGGICWGWGIIPQRPEVLPLGLFLGANNHGLPLQMPEKTQKHAPVSYLHTVLTGNMCYICGWTREEFE